MSCIRLLRVGVVAFVLVAASGVAQAETLREALASAYANNPNIMSALLSVASAAENIALAKSGTLPTIAAAANASASWDSVSNEFNPDLTLGLSYRQTLFDNFKTDAEIEAARAMSELATYSFQSAEQDVLLSVVNAYMSVIRDTELVRLTADNMKFFQAQVDSANERLRLGEGTKIDVSQANARLAQSLASYKTAIGNLQTSRASYERWVGHKPRNLSASIKFGNLIPKSLDQAIAEAESAHPAIKKARAAMRAAAANSDAAAAAFGPTLDLIGDLCALNCIPSVDTSVTASARLTLSVPLYAGGRLGAGARQANIEQVKSEVDALSARDLVRESVINAWSALQTAIAQIQSAQSAVESGQLALDGMIQQRDVGQATTLDVLNAQAELISTKQAQIGAVSGRVIAAFALIAATGHLSASDLKLDIPIKSAGDYILKVEDVWAELRAFE